MVCPGARVPALRCVAPRPVYRGQGPSGAGATAAQGGYLGAIARGTFEPRPFKGIPTVVRLGAPWGLGVPRASPPGRSPGWWGVARGPPYACAVLLVLSIIAFSVLSFCFLPLTVLLFAIVWL